MKRIFALMVRHQPAAESFPYGRQAMGPSIAAIRAKAEAHAKAQGDQPRAVYLLG